MSIIKKARTRLLKFVEVGPYCEGPTRIAYAVGSSKLPRSRKGLKWRPVGSFNVGEALSRDPRLKEVLERAIDKGCAIVLID
jgi:hypothetical protein